MAMVATPPGDGSQGAAKPILGRLTLHHPVVLLGQAPVVREPQQVKRARTWPSRVTSALSPSGLIERHQSGLVRMKSQPVSGEALREYFQYPSGIFFGLEDQDRIVRIANQARPTLQSRLDHHGKPCIQNLMEVDVRKDRGNHPTLWAARFRVAQLSGLQYTRFEPFADQTQKNPITYPLTKNSSKMAVVQSIEELTDVDLQDPPAPNVH